MNFSTTRLYDSYFIYFFFVTMQKNKENRACCGKNKLKFIMKQTLSGFTLTMIVTKVTGSNAKFVVQNAEHLNYV